MLSYRNQGIKVPMKVHAYTYTTAHRGRRGSPAVPAGTTVYVIRYADSRGYYTYAYLNRERALDVIAAMDENNTDTEFFCQWNRVFDPEQTLHVGEL